MKIAAVSQRIDDYPDRDEHRDALDGRISALLLAASLLPFPVPNHLGPHLSAWLQALAPNLIILSGGNVAGQKPIRDALEKQLLRHAEANRLPLLGICRGMQIMALHAGGDLKTVSGHVRTRHQLSGRIQRNVNSYHDQALSSVPDGYQVTATSEDGTIEAIRHHHLPWEGRMWHPERETPFPQEDLDDLRSLLA